MIPEQIRLGLALGADRPMERNERLGLGLPSNSFLCRDLRGVFGIRSGKKGPFIGELTREQLRILLANCDGGK